VGLKPILRTTTSFSALTLLVGSFDPQKTVPEMTYNVFSGTLNPTHFTSLEMLQLRRTKRRVRNLELRLGTHYRCSRAVVNTGVILDTRPACRK